MILYNPKNEPVECERIQYETLLKAGWTKEPRVDEKVSEPEPVKKVVPSKK